MTTERETCNCESAYCAQHGGDLETVSCDSCPNVPEGRYRMSFVGPICDECARVNSQGGGFAWVHRLGVWGRLDDLRAPELTRPVESPGIWPTLVPGRAYAVLASGRRYTRPGVLLAVTPTGDLQLALSPATARGRWRPWAVERGRVRGVFGVGL